MSHAAALSRHLWGALKDAHRMPERFGEDGAKLTRHSTGQEITRLEAHVETGIHEALSRAADQAGCSVTLHTRFVTYQIGDGQPYSVWAEALAGNQVYAAMAGQSGPTPGYGATYAIAEGQDPCFTDISVAGLVRFDTGDTLIRTGQESPWLDSLARNTANPYHARQVPPSPLDCPNCIILADASLRLRVCGDIPPYDTGSTLGHAHAVLAGYSLSGFKRARAAGALGRFGISLPAVHYLAKGIGGVVLARGGSPIDTLQIEPLARHENDEVHVLGARLSFVLPLAQQLV